MSVVTISNLPSHPPPPSSSPSSHHSISWDIGGLTIDRIILCLHPALGGSGLCCDSSCIIRTRATSTDPQISCQSLLVAGGWWVQACGGWVVKTPGPQPGHRGPRPATAPAPSSAQSREDRGERCLCDGRWLTHTGHQRA